MKYLDRFNAFFTGWSQEIIGICRIVIAFLFIAHGTQQIFNLPIPSHSGHVAQFPSLDWISGSIETWLGLLYLLGLFSQPLAFLFCGFCAVAYFMVHAKRGFWPIANNGEPAVLFCFAFLLLTATGGGAWSLDRLLARRSESSRPSQRDLSPGPASR
jgi:putative oxidoreductase